MGQIGSPVVSSYDHRLVVLSILVAILASYVALDLAVRVTAARGGVRRAWLAGGAILMELGIRSRPFVFMLALTLPIPVRYDMPNVYFLLGRDSRVPHRRGYSKRREVRFGARRWLIT